MVDEKLITLDNLRRYHLNLLDEIPINQIWRGSGAPPIDTDHIIAINYSKGIIYFKNELGGWSVLSGGGGSSDDSNVLSLDPDWYGKTISYGSLCEVGISWRSIYGGNPTGMIDYELFVVTPEGEERKEVERVVPIGSRTINLTNYLAPGTTEIIIRVSNKHSPPAQATLTVTTVNLEMGETFKEDKVYTSDVKYYCTPKGAKGKTKKMYVYLDDELVIDGAETDDDDILQTYPLTVNTHGTHSVRAYFTVQLEKGAAPIESPKVYSEFAYVVAGDTTPIVAANCGVNQLEEYDSTTFDWYGFTPKADGTMAESTPIVEIYHSSRPEIAKGEEPVSTVVNVKLGDRQEHTFKAEYPGDNYIIFKVGDYIVNRIHIKVAKSPVDVTAVTTNLLLNLSPQYHRQNDPYREQWVSETPEGKIVATLEDFNFTSDGWLTDDSGKSTVLRVRDDARVNIPVEIFTEEVNNTGMVIEFELATHDVLDYEATIIECMNSGIGIEVKANQAMLKTANNTLVTPFREGEQVRVTFVIESKDSATNLILIYINGVMSGAKQYTSTDNFAQSVVQDITIGSNLCTTDIYAIRVYKTALGRRDILTNWIADTQDRELLLERYKRNNVFYNNELHPDYLPEGLAYIVFYTNEDGLPKVKGKGEEKYLNGKYVDANREFTFTNAQLKVQGTSSSGYPRKNFTETFDDVNGILLNGVRAYDFQMNDKSIATNSFCFKTDYASSEGANNVELVKLFNEICPAKIPPQEDNPNVRQGIDGFPMVIFCYHDNAYYFIGKYNFANDKETPEVFGMTDGVESWEILNNRTLMGEYKEDDFGTIIWLPEKLDYGEKWLDTFKARYPDKNEKNYPDENGEYGELQKLVAWVRSTWRGEANPNADVDEVTYTETPTITVDESGKKKITWSNTSVTYTKDTEEYRLAKFKNDSHDWFDVEHLKFFYLFTDFFLMIDNREKNTFPTRYFNKKLNKWLWYFLPYDFDTALGINNSGELVFGHGLEDIDEGVYNGAGSVLWCNVRDCFADEIKDMYVRLRNQTDVFNYDEIIRRFTEHQRAWGEAIFNEDSYYKYIAILLGENGTSEHLPKLLGSKETQRNYWLYNRFRYYDAKCVTKDAYEEKIIIRPNYVEGSYNNHNLTITPYTDTYLSVNFDGMSGNSKPIPKRAKKGEPVTFYNSGAENSVVHIYNASQITDLGDLSGQHTSEFVGNTATRLQRLILGGDTVNTKLNHLSLGNNRLLKVLNVKNCPNLAGDIDISGCSGVEEVYFDGTSISSLVLPKGGTCKILHLPETITNLTVLNHKVTDFKMPNYNNLSTLWLELNSTSKGTFDLKTMLNTMINKFKTSEEGELGRLRVTNFELTGNKAFDTAAEVIAFYNDLRRYFKGLDANGNAGQDETSLQNMLQGKIQIKEQRGVLQHQLDEMKSKFPSVDIDYTRIRKFFVTFVNAEGTVLATQELDYGKMPTIPDCPTTGYHYICNGSLVEVTDDVTYVLTEEVDTYKFEWIIGSTVVTTYETYAPNTAPSTPSGYAYGDIVGDKAFLGFVDVGYRTGDRTRANGNPIIATLKSLATYTGLTWGRTGISSDTHNNISNISNTSFTAATSLGQNFALRKIGINTSELLGFATTIQSITIHFNGSADKDDGVLGIVRAVIGYVGLGIGDHYARVGFDNTSITINLNSINSHMLANLNGKQQIWFGLYETIADTVTARFTGVSFDITYHTDN